MEVDELKLLYDQLLKDKDFDKLDLGLQNPNIFEILGISKNEIRHSNFLCWILDPNQTHQLGDMFLKRFLREVFSSDKFEEIDLVDVERLDTSNVEVLREWNNVDILIRIENVNVCIENKVLSKEHSNQLSKYKRVVNSNFPNHINTFVFLSPEGGISDNESDIYEPISYGFVVETLETILDVFHQSLNSSVKNYIYDYITIIKRDLMGTDKLTLLSQQIYKNHRTLFDFIFEHKPDVLDEVNEIFDRVIEDSGFILGSRSKNYLRFTTKNIQNLTYINREPNGWKKKESFLFEIGLNKDSDRIRFKTVISPCDKDYNTERLSQILMEINGFKEPIGKKWLVNYSKTEVFPFSKIDDLSSDEIYQRFEKIISKNTKTIELVESKFMEYHTELIRMMNRR